jgi:hypothetical protein
MFRLPVGTHIKATNQQGIRHVATQVKQLKCFIILQGRMDYRHEVLLPIM